MNRGFEQGCDNHRRRRLSRSANQYALDLLHGVLLSRNGKGEHQSPEVGESVFPARDALLPCGSRTIDGTRVRRALLLLRLLHSLAPRLN